MPLSLDNSRPLHLSCRFEELLGRSSSRYEHTRCGWMGFFWRETREARKAIHLAMRALLVSCCWYEVSASHTSHRTNSLAYPRPELQGRV
jgi:hypothetical protein